MLAINTKALEFDLLDKDAVGHRLSQYQGFWVLVYFYPRDNTPGCTKEACSFRDRLADLKKAGVIILGISADTVTSHKKFSEKHHLNFTILADPTKKTIKDYQADNGLFTKRISYLIDPQGLIKKNYPKVDVEQHAEQILKDIKSFKL